MKLEINDQLKLNKERDLIQETNNLNKSGGLITAYNKFNETITIPLLDQYEKNKYSEIKSKDRVPVATNFHAIFRNTTSWFYFVA